MNDGGRKIWTFFAVVACAVFLGMGMLTTNTIRLEQAEADNERLADFHARLRLALWRMDSIVAPALAREASRPYYQYTAFYAPGHVYSPSHGPVAPGEVLLPSPLLQTPVDWIRLNFQVTADGNWTSPQAPTGRLLELVQKLKLPVAGGSQATDDLQRLARVITPALLQESRPSPEPGSSSEPGLAYSEPDRRPRAGDGAAPEAERQQRSESYHEAIARSNIFRRMLNEFSKRYEPGGHAVTEGDVPPKKQEPQPSGGSGTLAYSPLVPGWFEDAAGNLQLVYLRTVQVGDELVVQGFWVDWPRLREGLLHQVRDLFARADLAPIGTAAPVDFSRSLIAVPAWLMAQPPRGAPLPLWTPLRLSLAFAWVALFAGLAAVALGLRRLTELSERRLDFVSAVSHELRTPLTTFRMYSEMLADDMISDPDQRREYCRTLEREAKRLSHLVQNVLDYSRLERRAWEPSIEETPVANLLSAATDTLNERCRAADMELVIENQTPPDTAVRTDPAAVQQIIYNLVDNACKYAHTAADKRVHLRASLDNGALALDVIDHGSGIDPAAAGYIFAAFRRGKDQRHRSQPGVGLGLALSRRWAHTLGASLTLAANGKDGARFRLTLPQ